MASQTKVEPVEEASTSAAPNAAGNGGGEALSDVDDDSEDDQPAQSAMAAAVLMADDEDVSLDELLISDGADDDDEDDATEVHEGLHRVAMQELGALQTADSSDTPAPPVAAETLEADDVDSISVDLEAPTSEAASGTVEVHASEDIPVSEERAAAVEEPSQTNVESPEASASDLDESPEAAAARAAADQEAVAAAAERARADADSDPESSILVSDDAIESDDAPSEAISALDETRLTDAAESTPPPLEDGKEESLIEAESVRAGPSDAPLPSFDIPEVESSLSRARRPLGLVSELETHAVAPLAPLSEDAEEDDDDAVTNIGLPIPETGAEYPVAADSGFAAAEPAAMALSGFDAHAALDARRAATRIIPRIDPSKLAPGGTGAGFDADRRADTMRPLAGSARPLAVGNWFARLFGRESDVQRPLAGEGGLASNRRLGWLVDNVLPPLSLIFLGSGIGAGIMLLQQKDTTSGEHDRAVQALEAAGANKRPTTLLERAEAGDGDALFKITNMAPNERTSALTLALEAGSRAQKLNEFREFSKALQTPPKELGPVVGRVIAYATSPETMLPTFDLLSQWTGPRGPDVMYAIWEKAGSSRAASLAQELLHSADQRAKATPALAAAVDLRAATTCDDYQAVLPAVIRSGDQRCVAALRTLKHTDGCGDDGKQDCYACLRDNNQLDEALTAVEKRPAPAL